MKDFYEDIERRLNELLVEIGETLSDSEKREVVDFIGHGEYGLALETLCFILAEEKKTISGECMTEITRLKKDMKMK